MKIPKQFKVVISINLGVHQIIFFIQNKWSGEPMQAKIMSEKVKILMHIFCPTHMWD